MERLGRSVGGMAEPAKPSLWNFGLAFRELWFAAMSGGASVPFAFLAVILDNKYAQIIFGSMAFVCAWFAAYRVWKGEREKVLELEAKLAPTHIRTIEAQEANIVALNAHTEAVREQTEELRRQCNNPDHKNDSILKAFREKRIQGKLPVERQLNEALFWIVEHSAWGRWQYAQMGGAPQNESLKMHTGAIALQMKAETGELPIIGRRKGSVAPEPVPPDLLKSVAYLHIEPDLRQLWKVSVRPRSDLDEETASKIPNYASLEADWHRVQELWPENDAQIDALTETILQKHKDG